MEATLWFRWNPHKRISVKAQKRMGYHQMNTIDCSPKERNRLSSMVSRKSLDDSKKLIGSGIKDSQESAWLEPGSVLRRVQPYLYEFAGAQPEKPNAEQAG